MRLLYPFPEPLPLPKARGIQVAWTVDALCHAGVDVTLAYVPSPQGHPLSPVGKTSPSNLTLLPLSRNWPFPFQRWHSVRRFCHSLAKQLTQQPPDVVFVRHLKLAHCLLRVCPDLPLVYEAHEVFAETAIGPKRKKLASIESEVLQHAAGVVFISTAVQNALRQRYGVAGTEIVLHSGVNLPPAVPEKPWDTCGRHIIYAGSLFEWKGVDDLLTAAARLPGCKMTLIGGEESDIARLQARIDPGGAEVELLPRLPTSAIMARLLDACIAVLPNRSDGVSQFTSPLKLFEYMGAGCAIVAADLPSIREVLPADATGWFKAGDPGDLALAVRRLVADPARARAEGLRWHALAQRYTWSSRAEALKEYFAGILGQRNPSDPTR